MKQQKNQSLHTLMISKKKKSYYHISNYWHSSQTYSLRGEHSVHSQRLFVTARCGTCMVCFGTTQDIPAGLYQPEFQDTASLSYAAKVPAKNTHTLTSTLTTDTSMLRQRRLIQMVGQKEEQIWKRKQQKVFFSCFEYLQTHRVLSLLYFYEIK